METQESVASYLAITESWRRTIINGDFDIQVRGAIGINPLEWTVFAEEMRGPTRHWLYIDTKPGAGFRRPKLLGMLIRAGQHFVLRHQ